MLDCLEACRKESGNPEKIADFCSKELRPAFRMAIGRVCTLFS
jgi:hypothetical protein